MRGSGLADGATVGIGNLPHRDRRAAARFAVGATDIPTVPSLPRRSPVEELVGQALVGIVGVTVGQYGSIAIDPDRFDPDAPVALHVDDRAFDGVREFLRQAQAANVERVKWQCVGPVTLGLTLVRGGVEPAVAFEVASRAVRARADAFGQLVHELLPGATQLAFIDEPAFVQVADDESVIAPDVAIDLVSAALASVQLWALAGVHVCGSADLGQVLAAGPSVLSVPIAAVTTAAAGQLANFLAAGGVVAWGAVPTEGPIATSVTRPWNRLNALWCDLVRAGVDPVLLRANSLITPECGLGAHTPAVAERVYALTAEIGARVRDQANASRWVLGA